MSRPERDWITGELRYRRRESSTSPAGNGLSAALAWGVVVVGLTLVLMASM